MFALEQTVVNQRYSYTLSLAPALAGGSSVNASVSAALPPGKETRYLQEGWAPG